MRNDRNGCQRFDRVDECLYKNICPNFYSNKFQIETRKNESFGTSLLLAHSCVPMSPKIINGSYAAIFDNNDVLFEFAKKLSQFRYGQKDSPGKSGHGHLTSCCHHQLNEFIFTAMRRRIRGMLVSGKQLSLDSRMDLVQSLVRGEKDMANNGQNPDEFSDGPSDIEEASEGNSLLFE
jgi:histidine decarboxylase